MLPRTILILLPLIMSCVNDVMESFDASRLDEAIRDYKDLNGTSTDEAQQALAKKFDEAFDWNEALSSAGVGGALVGDVLEYLDYQIWYMAIKVHCKRSSRRRTRLLNKFNRGVPAMIDEYLANVPK